MAGASTLDARRRFEVATILEVSRSFRKIPRLARRVLTSRASKSSAVDGNRLRYSRAAMATTIKASVDCEQTVSRLEEHLRGATEHLDKFKALRAPEVERGQRAHSPEEKYWERESREAPILQSESIGRRRTLNALIGELTEALEAARNLPRDPLY